MNKSRYGGLWVGLCVAAALCDCEADPLHKIDSDRASWPTRDGDDRDGGRQDAGFVDNVLASRDQPPPPLAQVRFDAGAAARDDESAWRAARSFELKIQAMACYGLCPSYWATVDQVGHVHFRGTQYVAKPGSYATSISPSAARQLYEDVIDSGFLQMRERYQETADGCEALVTDFDSYGFRLEAEAHVKEVHYYRGCIARLPELATLESLFEHIRVALPLAALIGPGARICPPVNGDLQDGYKLYKPSYVLRNAADEAVGLLQLDLYSERLHRTWQVSTCDGDVLAGDVASTSVYSCDAPIITQKDEEFAWPGIDHPISGALMDRTGELTVKLKIQELDSETVQLGTAGDACAR